LVELTDRAAPGEPVSKSSPALPAPAPTPLPCTSPVSGSMYARAPLSGGMSRESSLSGGPG